MPLKLHLIILFLLYICSIIRCENDNITVVSDDNERVTVDGCPYAFDLGNFGYNYKKPSICHGKPFKAEMTKLPSVPPTFQINMETVEEADSAYYEVVLSVIDGLSDTFSGVVLKVMKVKQDGSFGEPVGHFDLRPPWQKAYCCGKSKFKTLAYFFVDKPDERDSTVGIRWYPMNFKKGQVAFKAYIYNDESSYWSVKSPEYTIPLTVESTTLFDDEK